MRLYPPGVFLIREPLTEDFHLMGITIPKATWIHVRSTPSLHCISTLGHRHFGHAAVLMAADPSSAHSALQMLHM